MGAYSLSQLRRRAVSERQVIALLRGGGPDIARSNDRRFLDLWRRDTTSFSSLSVCARWAGLSVLAPGAPWISADELNMVRWLADAQHGSGLTAPDPPAEVTLYLARCANLLLQAGLRLPRATPVAFAPLALQGRLIVGEGA